MRTAALALLAMLAACATPPPPTASATAPRRAPVIWTIGPATSAEIAAARASVLRSLRDPESARFSEMYAMAGSNGQRGICGLVNARNGFGGYTGDTLFHVATTGGVVFANDRDGRLLLPALCRERTVN